MSYSKATSTQTVLLYPARGAATVWADGCVRPAAGPVEELLGAARARLLAALRSPATTSALARRFGVTPGAVSQHLAVLHRGGLVDRHRSGRAVLYQASGLGLALLDRGGSARACALTEKLVVQRVIVPQIANFHSVHACAVSWR